jgi:hypothetical protein
MTGVVATTITVVGTLTGAGAMTGVTTLTFTPSGTLTDASAPPAVTEQPSGGYGFFNEYELYRQRRARRKAQERREQEEADEIQADLDRQIAKLLKEQEAKDAERADFARLQRIADAYAGTRQPVPRPIAATMLKAYEERSRNALEQLEREMNRMLEEEEMTVLQLMLNGDL